MTSTAMSKTNKLLIDASRLPSLPEGVTSPEPELVLRLLAAAYQGLQSVYDVVASAAKRDVKSVVDILASDWRSRTADLHKRIIALHGEQPAAEKIVESPRKEDIESIASTLSGAPLSDVLKALRGVARHCCIASRLVPWNAGTAAVDQAFRTALNAEDEHLGHLEWITAHAS